ncbi:MAG TPA: bifunctional serine/threonine-protein kinase/formylglycine-generating enzyme family protein, partial [Planctomycetaceae bacterium]|nr:bifunctional serine/threonine-protein kinase/formylglycine-generating enzyme family protein [Planctomycetaceae bacterium]
MPSILCPARNQWESWLLGDVSADEAVAAEEHLTACPGCQETLRDLRPQDWLTQGLARANAQPLSPEATERIESVISRLKLNSPARDVRTTMMDAVPSDTSTGAVSQTPSNGLSAAQTVQLEAGATLGNYVIRQQLGSGGMGAVFLAWHRRMDRLVALKVLAPQLVQDPASQQRFEREVRALARLSHPNIVAAHDADEADGVHFLVMEYVAGRDLSAIVHDRGPLPVAEAIDCTLQAARGLAYAHEQGMVHRDIKPSNLLRDDRGVVKILDLGLARLEEPQSDRLDLTHSGAVMGTLDYMSPEQALDTRTAGPASDIYSLGCTLYFLLTGKAPFGGISAMQRLLAHREQPIPNVCEVRTDAPPELQRILARMLAKQAGDRYPTAGELIAELEQLQTQRNAPSSSSPVPALNTTRPKSTRGRTRWLIGSALALIAGGLAAIIWIETSKGRFVIETADDQATVAVSEAGVKLIDLQNNRTYLLKPGSNRLPNGDYEIAVSELPSGVEFETQRFQIRSGKTVRATARFVGAAQKSEVAQGTGEAPAVVQRVNPDKPPPKVAVDDPVAGKPQSLPLPADPEALPPWDLPAGAPDPAIVPFTPEQARQHQAAWAKYLKRPPIEKGADGLEFALIPPGEFTLSFVSNPADPEGDDKLRHKVRLTVPFYLGTTEVTREQFGRFVEATGYRTEPERNPGGAYWWDPISQQGGYNPEFNWRKPGGFEVDPQMPVTQISLADAAAYCTWLTQQDGRLYRLPTEAEWQFAFRAGGSLYPSNASTVSDLVRLGWLPRNPQGTEAGRTATITRVAQTERSPWGLFDQVGNAQEFCIGSVDAKCLEAAG